MTLYDFIYLALENYYECVIWDCTKECNIYEGTLDEIPSKLLNREFSSWEITEDGKIGLNID